MKHILFFLSSALLFQSCSEDFFSQTVEIDPPPYTRQLSFHLQLNTNDSILRVQMTRNFGILEDPASFTDYFVNGASAEIYENGQPWLTLHPSEPTRAFELEGVLPHPFVAGNTYEIRATHPDFPALSATQIVPADFVIDSVRIRYDAVIGESGGKLNLLEAYLQDQPGVKNYYEVTLLGRFYNIEYNNFGMDTLGIIQYPLYVDDYNDPNIQAGYNESGLISDQFFDGQPYKFQARFYGRPYDLIDSSIVVRIRSVTEDYFKWSRSYQAKYEADDNPLSEPISVFNNLDNGLGIFSIAQEKQFEIRQ